MGRLFFDMTLNLFMFVHLHASEFLGDEGEGGEDEDRRGRTESYVLERHSLRIGLQHSLKSYPDELSKRGDETSV